MQSNTSLNYNAYEKLIITACFFLLIGIFTSVSIPALYHILILIPIIWYFVKRKPFIKLSISSKILFVYAIWMVVSYFINIEDLQGGSKNLGKLKYIFISILSIFPIRDFLQSQLINEDKKIKLIKTLKILFFSLLTTLILAATYGLVQKLFHFDLFSFKTIPPIRRIKGFTQVMRYGYGSSLALILIIGIYLQCKNIFNQMEKRFIKFAILMSFLGMFFTFTRGSLFAFVCALPIVIYYYKKKMAMIIAGLYLIGGVLGAGYFYFKGFRDGQYLFRNTSGSDQKRISQYKAAFYGFKDNFFAGLGPKQFSYNVLKIKEKYNLGRKDYKSHSHNIFLENAANLGIIGLILFILWIVFWIAELNIMDSNVKKIVLPFLFTFLIGGQFEYVFDANNSFLIFFVFTLSQINWEQIFFHSKEVK